MSVGERVDLGVRRRGYRDEPAAPSEYRDRPLRQFASDAIEDEVEVVDHVLEAGRVVVDRVVRPERAQVVVILR